MQSKTEREKKGKMKNQVIFIVVELGIFYYISSFFNAIMCIGHKFTFLDQVMKKLTKLKILFSAWPRELAWTRDLTWLISQQILQLFNFTTASRGQKFKSKISENRMDQFKWCLTSYLTIAIESVKGCNKLKFSHSFLYSSQVSTLECDFWLLLKGVEELLLVLPPVCLFVASVKQATSQPLKRRSSAGKWPLFRTPKCPFKTVVSSETPAAQTSVQSFAYRRQSVKSTLLGLRGRAPSSLVSSSAATQSQLRSKKWMQNIHRNGFSTSWNGKWSSE